MNKSEKIREMVNALQDAQNTVRHLGYDLMMEIAEYDGSLMDALADGLIRLNFPAPSNIRRSMIENHISSRHRNNSDI